MSGVKVRALTAADVEGAAAVVADFDPALARLAERDLREHFAGGGAPGARFWGAEVDGRVAGVVGVHDDPDADVQGVLWMVWLFVARAARGKGVGAALARAALAEARARGCRKVCLDVGNPTAHRAAIELYVRMGFRKEAHLRDYFRPGEDKLVYTLDLHPEAPAPDVAGTAAAAVPARPLWRLAGGARVLLQEDYAAVAGPRQPEYVEASAHRETLARMATAGGVDALPPELCRRLQAAGLVAWRAEPEDPRYGEIVRALDAGFRWMLPPEGAPLYEMALELHAARKLMDHRFGQGPCLPETNVRRALLLAERHPGGRVLFLGDADLVAPLAARLGCRVHVSDLDGTVLDAQRAAAARHGVEVATTQWDFTTGVPTGLRGRFDAVVADPPSSRPWFRLVLSRALSALAPGGEAFLAVYPRAQREARGVAEELGMEMADHLAGFCHYLSDTLAYLPDFDADLMVLRAGPGARPTVPADGRWTAGLDGEGTLRYLYAVDLADCRPTLPWPDAAAALRGAVTRFFPGSAFHWTESARGPLHVLGFTGPETSGHIALVPRDAWVGIDILFAGGVSLVPLRTECNRLLAPERVAQHEMLRFV